MRLVCARARHNNRIMPFATSMHRYGFILVAPGHVLDTVCVQEEMVCERYGGVCVLTVSLGYVLDTAGTSAKPKGSIEAS